MRGMIGGMLAGGLVSVIGLGSLSMVSEQPAGRTPPEAPLVDAPQVGAVEPEGEATPSATQDGPSSPVGAVTIDAPLAPALPDGEGGALSTPTQIAPDAAAPRADTDPLDEPNVLAVEGAMTAPETSDVAGFGGDPIDPVLPNPQGQAPQTPDSESNLIVSTAPAQPTVVIEPDTDTDTPDADPAMAEDDEPTPLETFIVDLGAGNDMPEGEAPSDDASNGAAPTDDVVAGLSPEAEAPDAQEQSNEPATSRLQLQGGENTLLTDRDTGVTIRRPATQTAEAATPDEATDAPTNALELYAADAPATGDTPIMSIVLIDDGSMSAAAAALAGLPFAVTIALDPALPKAAELMSRYRENGFEVVALAKLPEGAVPSDVEITFQSVFDTLPESIAVLDVGDGGLQVDRDVTTQAMEILAEQGRGFVNAGQGLNMAGRAAQTAGVPAALIYRDLDIDGQDARVVRRFVDQAAFRARQESGVVLVGRVRPDTISALILWGTANSNDQVVLVPLSSVLLAQ